MRWLISMAVVAVAVAAGVRSQVAAGTIVEALADARATAVGCLWRHAGDPVSFAEAAVAAHCRAELVRRQFSPAIVTVHVDAALAVVVAVLPAKAATSAAAMLATLGDGGDLDADTIARVQARVALAADDFATLLPGGVLTAAALQRAGASGLVDARTMLELPASRVRELLRAMPFAAIQVRGRVPDDLRQAVAGRTVAPVPWTGGVVDLAPGRGEQTHTRLDQPFVMAAFAVPDAVPSAALLVGVEVARERAARRLPLRGSELRAGTPVVAFAPQAGDTLVRFFRRGEAYLDLLPGEVAPADAAAEGTATAAELEGLLTDLRERAPTAAELSNARTHAVAESGLAPPTVAGSDPAVLGGRLLQAMLSRHRGLDGEAMPSVTAADAHAALRHLLQPSRAYWHTLLPVALRDRGWRRR